MANRTSKKRKQLPCFRMILLLICVSLLVGCGNASNTASQTTSGQTATSQVQPSANAISLAYTATDSLNPYLAKTKTNQELSRLLYDGLIIMDSSMNIGLRLASKVENKGNTVTVTLKNTKFSDGSPLTSADVVYSYSSAIQAEHLSYKQDFRNVQQVEESGTGTVIFHLQYEDPYFQNFLDFPIYKKGTANKKNEDNKELPPIGCGRYVFHEESGSYWLTANTGWWGGVIATSKITLLNLPDSEAINHGVQVGTVQWYFSDLQNNTYPGGRSFVSKQVPLQNLVYVGCNINGSLVSQQEIRMGISYALNRKKIAENAFFGAAIPAKGMYPSGLEVTSGMQTLEEESNKETAISWFEKAGYTKLSAEGYRQNGNQTLSLRLIYNKENDARVSMATLVASQLKEAGCKVLLEPCTVEQYQLAVKTGSYDLYIGEMKIPDNLDLYPFITAGGLKNKSTNSESASQSQQQQNEDSASSQYEESSLPQQEEQGDVGIMGTQSVSSDASTAVEAAYRYHIGTGSLTEMVSCMNEQLPVIPVCHRTGILLYANSISGNPTPLADDPFYGIESCAIRTDVQS